MANVLKVFLENGQTKSFKYDSTTTVQVSDNILAFFSFFLVFVLFLVQIEGNYGKQFSFENEMEKFICMQKKDENETFVACLI